MNPIFKKLQFKDQQKVVILNAPESFQEDMAEMQAFTQVQGQLKGDNIPFFLGFAEMGSDLDKIIESIKGKLSKDDPILWIAYPRNTNRTSTVILVIGVLWEKWALKAEDK